MVTECLQHGITPRPGMGLAPFLLGWKCKYQHAVSGAFWCDWVWKIAWSLWWGSMIRLSQFLCHLMNEVGTCKCITPEILILNFGFLHLFINILRKTDNWPEWLCLFLSENFSWALLALILHWIFFVLRIGSILYEYKFQGLQINVVVFLFRDGQKH